MALIVALLAAVGVAGYSKFSPTPRLHQWGLPTIIARVNAKAITGRASVIDGDTIDIHGTRIRLFGIDAPESGQSCTVQGKASRCGQAAALALADKIGGNAVECQQKDQDRYGRVVAVCRVGGEDINAWMVAQGWALAYRHYSNDYVSQEGSASKSKVGIWRGEFTPPWDWRRGNSSRRNSENKRPSPAKAREPQHTIYYRPGDNNGVWYNTTEECMQARRRNGGACVEK